MTDLETDGLPAVRPARLRKTVAQLLLGASLLSSSSIGVIQNYIEADGIFLKNAWR